MPAPGRVEAFGQTVAGDDLDDWDLLPAKPDWAGGLRARWRPGEAGAMARLRAFLKEGLVGYEDRRDFPADTVTSNLSPFLHIGDIGPRQVWHETIKSAGWSNASEKFLKELVWREFAYHVFYHLPDLPEEPMYPKFREFPWKDDDGKLACWQRGMTGYPMVDAGMRELWQTGHMHNRVRMVTASFLVKHLLLPWQAGEAWFWDTLVDASLASNTLGWQWAAGCGADAAPYFRVFNPQLQSEKFDADGVYLKRWVPELGTLPPKALHAPWNAAVPPADYRPIIDLKVGRERALTAYAAIKG